MKKTYLGYGLSADKEVGDSRSLVALIKLCVSVSSCPVVVGDFTKAVCCCWPGPVAGLSVPPLFGSPVPAACLFLIADSLGIGRGDPPS